VASDPITAEAQKQLLVDIFLNTFHREGARCPEKWLTISVENISSHWTTSRVRGYDTSLRRYQASDKERRQNTKEKVVRANRRIRWGCPKFELWRAFSAG